LTTVIIKMDSTV